MVSLVDRGKIASRKACAIPADKYPAGGGFYPHPPLMCVVDRARVGPISCPTHAPFRPTLNSRPKLERESSPAGFLPVPSRLNSHACIEAAKHLLHLPPITLPIPPPTPSLSSSLYLVVFSQHRQDAREGPRGLLVIPIRHFSPPELSTTS